jgi:hypothetical protein
LIETTNVMIARRFYSVKKKPPLKSGGFKGKDVQE